MESVLSAAKAAASFIPRNMQYFRENQKKSLDTIRHLDENIHLMDYSFDYGLDKLLEKYPDSLAVWEEKLFLGRLAHRDKRRVDFSLIKFHLMNLYLTPETFSEVKRQEMRT